jgi:hypothetical protein
VLTEVLYQLGVLEPREYQQCGSRWWLTHCRCGLGAGGHIIRRGRLRQTGQAPSHPCPPSSLPPIPGFPRPTSANCWAPMGDHRRCAPEPEYSTAAPFLPPCCLHSSTTTNHDALVKRGKPIQAYSYRVVPPGLTYEYCYDCIESSTMFRYANKRFHRMTAHSRRLKLLAP